MPNKNIPDLPAGAANGGYLLEQYNTFAARNEYIAQSLLSTLFSQSVQTQSRFNLSVGGNTAGALALISSGVLSLFGGNNLTVSQNGNSLTLSVFNQSVQTQNLIAGVSLGGNTAGVLAAITSGSMSIFGGNNVTVSQNGNSVTISAFNQTVQTQNIIAGVSLGGNTAGVLVAISSGSMSLFGGNNVTLSQNGNSVTISAFNQSVQTQNIIAGVSLGGNTAGVLAAITSGSLSLFGGPNITVSQNGNSVSISGASGGAAPTINFFQNAWGAGTVTSNMVTNQNNFRQISFCPLMPDAGIFRGNMTVNTFLMMQSQSGSTATMSSAFTSQLVIGLYTNNAGTLSLLNSVSTSWGSNAGNANLSSSYVGLRWISIHSSLWSVQPTLSQGHYWIGWQINSTGVSCQTNSPVMIQLVPTNAGLFGTVGVATGASISNAAFLPYLGSYSVTSAAMPTSVNESDIGVLGSSSPRIPYIVLNSQITTF